MIRRRASRGFGENTLLRAERADRCLMTGANGKLRGNLGSKWPCVCSRVGTLHEREHAPVHGSAQVTTVENSREKKEVFQQLRSTPSANLSSFISLRSAPSVFFFLLFFLLARTVPLTFPVAPVFWRRRRTCSERPRGLRLLLNDATHGLISSGSPRKNKGRVKQKKRIKS